MATHGDLPLTHKSAYTAVAAGATYAFRGADVQTSVLEGAVMGGSRYVAEGFLYHLVDIVDQFAPTVLLHAADSIGTDIAAGVATGLVHQGVQHLRGGNNFKRSAVSIASNVAFDAAICAAGDIVSKIHPM